MKPVRVVFGRVFNMGNDETIRLELEAELADGEDLADVVLTLGAQLESLGRREIAAARAYERASWEQNVGRAPAAPEET